MLIQRKFKLTSINRLIHPFRFDNHSVYFIAPKKSKFHESFLELYADDFEKKISDKGHKFFLISDTIDSNDVDDIATIYDHYFPYISESKERQDEDLSKKLTDFFQVPATEQGFFINTYKNTLTISVIEDDVYTIEKNKNILFDIENTTPFYHNPIINPSYFAYKIEWNYDELGNDISAYWDNIAFAPASIDENHYYLNLDDDTKDSVQQIVEKLNSLHENGKFITALPFLQKQIQHLTEKQEIKLSSVFIDQDFKILLPEFGNREIKLSHLTKSVYLLFLVNNDIDLTEISNHKTELFNIYKHISYQENLDKMEDTINHLIMSPDELYVHFSRIKSAFCKQFDIHIARHYFITGRKNQPKKIILDKKLIDWDNQHKRWFLVNSLLGLLQDSTDFDDELGVK